MSDGTAKKADLHRLVDELPEDRVTTAHRFLALLRHADEADNFIARFLTTMDPDEAALLQGLGELDDEIGPPPFTPDERAA